MKVWKLFIFILLGVITSSIFVLNVSADMGPKPTAVIEVLGINEGYAFDLMVYENNPVDVLTSTEIDEQISYNYYTDTFPAILNGYQDADGYASYTLYTTIPHVIRQEDTNTFYIGYFRAPDVFKIAIVTESNNVYVSNVITKTLFSARFTYDFSTDTVIEQALSTTNTFYPGVGDVSENIPVLTTILTALLGVVITLAIEVGLLFIAQYREKKTYMIVLWTNIATQLILNLFVFYGILVWSIFGGIGILLLGEVIVLVIEMIVYQKMFEERQWLKPIPYAILANLLSFVLGWLILTFFMGWIAYL